jgi:hypothetical protein
MARFDYYSIEGLNFHEFLGGIPLKPVRFGYYGIEGLDCDEFLGVYP